MIFRPIDDFANATLLTTTTNVSVTVTNIVASKETGEPKTAGARRTFRVVEMGRAGQRHSDHQHDQQHVQHGAGDLHGNEREQLTTGRG